MKCPGGSDEKRVDEGESLMRYSLELDVFVCVCARAHHCIYNAVDPFTLHHISRGLLRVVLLRKKTNRIIDFF